MTTFFDLVARRQSDRAFDPDRPVEKEKSSGSWRQSAWLLRPAIHSPGILS